MSTPKIPVQITDKNGKLTTVHRNAITGVSSERSTTTSVPKIVQNTPSEITRLAVDDFSTVVGKYLSPSEVDDITDAITSIDDDNGSVVEAVSEIVGRRDREPWRIMNLAFTVELLRHLKLYEDVDNWSANASDDDNGVFDASYEYYDYNMHMADKARAATPVKHDFTSMHDVIMAEESDYLLDFDY